jgi:hypothetical protein
LWTVCVPKPKEFVSNYQTDRCLRNARPSRSRIDIIYIYKGLKFKIPFHFFRGRQTSSAQFIKQMKSARYIKVENKNIKLVGCILRR